MVTTSGIKVSSGLTPSIIDEQKTPKNIIRYHKKQQNNNNNNRGQGGVEASGEGVNMMSLSSNSAVPKSPNA